MITMDGSPRDAGVRKAYVRGTHRSVAPQVTLERVRPLLPVMGITRIANVTGLDCIGIPVVMVCRPNSRSLSVSQGKGLDLWAAKASGVMESIELYHGEHISLPLKLATYEEMRYTHPMVDLAALPRSVSSVFHGDLRLLWIEGHDLLRDEPAWVPHQVVSVDSTLPFPPGTGCFAGTSNGLASGNHILEAISHGICEVVERDATTLWRVMSDEARARAHLDLSTVDDPGCGEVLEKFEAAGVAVAVWDTTTDVGIPAFFCHIVDRAVDPLRRVMAASGMGCHPARHIALLRALTEAAQSRLTYISGARDDFSRELYARRRDPEQLRVSSTFVQAGVPARRFGDVPTWEGETLEADVAWELERLRGAGLDRVIMVDLTKAELNLPVVRVVIPGLEGPESHIEGYVYGPRARALAGLTP